MIQSSRATNFLLAVIAVCLVIIALRPADLLPIRAAAAQDRQGYQERGMNAEQTRQAASQMSAITAPDPSAQLQADALHSIAASFDSMARSFESISKSVDDLSRTASVISERMGGQAQPGAAAADTGAEPINFGLGTPPEPRTQPPAAKPTPSGPTKPY
jgi:hypothetical protein